MERTAFRNVADTNVENRLSDRLGGQTYSDLGAFKSGRGASTAEQHLPGLELFADAGNRSKQGKGENLNPSEQTDNNPGGRSRDQGRNESLNPVTEADNNERGRSTDAGAQNSQNQSIEADENQKGKSTDQNEQRSLNPSNEAEEIPNGSSKPEPKQDVPAPSSDLPSQEVPKATTPAIES